MSAFTSTDGREPEEYLECDCAAKVTITTQVGSDGEQEMTIRLAEAGKQITWESDGLVGSSNLCWVLRIETGRLAILSRDSVPNLMMRPASPSGCASAVRARQGR